MNATIRRTPYATLLMMAAAGGTVTPDDIKALTVPPGESATAFLEHTRGTVGYLQALRAAGARGIARKEARQFAEGYGAAFPPGELPHEPRHTDQLVDETDPAVLAAAVAERNGAHR